MINKDIVYEIIKRCDLMDRYVCILFISKKEWYIKKSELMEYNIQDIIECRKSHGNNFLLFLGNNYIEKFDMGEKSKTISKFNFNYGIKYSKNLKHYFSQKPDCRRCHYCLNGYDNMSCYRHRCIESNQLLGRAIRYAGATPLKLKYEFINDQIEHLI